MLMPACCCCRFVRMDLALAIDDVELQRQIMYSKMILSGYIPPGEQSFHKTLLTLSVTSFSQKGIIWISISPKWLD